MDGACRPIANGWKDEPVIDIAGLYKIFGGDPAGALLLVRGKGIRRAELLERHNSVLALKDVTLSMPARRIQVIMGLSGSGKSTLIRHINRLVEPTAGRVTVDGEDVLALSKPALREFRRRKTAMVFQRFALLPHRTVAQNVAYGLAIQGRGAEEIKRLTAYWLDRVGLGGQGDRYPGQLSGGMQQRVGLARALATDAEILLMDEPFSALDPLIRRDMQDMLLALQAELHKTIVFITHDLDEAIRIGDDIAILRDGEIVQQGSAEQIVLNPADGYIADFVRDIDPGRVVRVRSIMHPARDVVGGFELGHGMLVADAARRFAETGAETARVIDDAGTVIGVVAARDIMAALVRT